MNIAITNQNLFFLLTRKEKKNKQKNPLPDTGFRNGIESTGTRDCTYQEASYKQLLFQSYRKSHLRVLLLTSQLLTAWLAIYQS